MNSSKRSRRKNLPLSARRKRRCSLRPNSWSKPILSPGPSTKWRDGSKWSGDNSGTQPGGVSDCSEAAPPASDCAPERSWSQSIEVLSNHGRVRSLFLTRRLTLSDPDRGRLSRLRRSLGPRIARAARG